MIITPLGHTEFLVDIANTQGENIRILVDSWLSDFAIGDLMERTVKVIIDPEKIATIDAIYISHTHTDHLDPYTLISLYRSRPGNMKMENGKNFGDNESGTSNNTYFPLLILPVTLQYLTPLFIEYLPNTRIHWLGNRETFTLKGIEISGHMFPQSEITNEDDVMMLSISSETELLFAEIDTVPDEYDIGVQESLFRIFTRLPYRTACYLASRNELEGQIRIYDMPQAKRSSYRDQYKSERKESIRESYEKYSYEEYMDYPNLMTLPGFVRGYIGQGIRYPEVLSPDLAVLSIFPLDAIASLESDIAKSFGYEFPQKALLPGRQYKIENGNIEAGRKECPIGELIRHHDEGSDLGSGKQSMDYLVPRNDAKGRLYASGPLFPHDHTPESIEKAKGQLLEILNHRFLPYWSASPIASFRDGLLKSKDGSYRLSFSVIPATKVNWTKAQESVPWGKPGIQYSGVRDSGSSPEGRKKVIIFEYSFSSIGFREVAYVEGMNIDEDYWLDDLLDFLEGRQELYSNFWHTLDPKRIYRLWTCLGANYMNHDLVVNKYRFHFDRAIQGLTAESYISLIFPHLS